MHIFIRVAIGALSVAPITAAIAADPQPRPAKDTPAQAEMVKLHENFLGAWRIDVAATIKAAEEQDPEMAEFMRESVAVLASAELQIAQNEIINMGSDQPIAIDVFKSTKDEAVFDVLSHEAEPMRVELKLIEDDKIRWEYLHEPDSPATIWYRLKDGPVTEDPEAFIQGRWVFDIERARTLPQFQRLDEQDRQRELEKLAETEFTITADEFSGIEHYTLHLISENRFAVQSEGETYMTIEIQDPDRMTIRSGRDYPLKRAAPKEPDE